MVKIGYNYFPEHWKNKHKKTCASKNISSPHKLSQYTSHKLIILGDPLCPRNTLQASNKKILNKINSNQVSSYFI